MTNAVDILNAEDKAAFSALRRWREAVPNDRLAHLLKDAVRGMSRSLQIRLIDHSVSSGHWKFLRILWEQDGLMQRELSELAGVRDPTTYSSLLAMEKLGYIKRSKSEGDSKKLIFLTPKGRALKEVLVPLAGEVNDVAVRGLPAAHVAIIRKGLLQIVANLEEDELQLEKSFPPSRKL